MEIEKILPTPKVNTHREDQLIPGLLSSRLVVFFSHIPERGLGGRVPDPGGQWPLRSISLRLFFLLKLCQLLEKVESRDAPGLRVWLLGGTLGPSKGARVRARVGGY